MNMNKETLQAFRVDFQSTVKELEEKYKAQIKLGNITYGDISFTAKVEVTSGANQKEVEKNRFLDDLKTYGYRYPVIELDHFENGLDYYGEKIRIVGFKPRSRKYPILYSLNGKRYKAPYDRIKSQIERHSKVI